MAIYTHNADTFSIHSRPGTKGAVFYCQFRRPDGTWGTAKSTRIRDQGKKADYAAAVAWAQSYLDSGEIVTHERVTFEGLARDFFAWDGVWVKEKLLRGRRISQLQAKNHQESVDNYLVPAFGKLRLSAIEDETIRRWQRELADRGLSGSTINRKSVALRLILKDGYRRGLLRRLPIVEAVAERQRSRGIFTPQEIRALFSARWPDRRCETMNLLAAATGLRAGEAAGLQEGRVHADYLEIVQTWTGPRWGLGPTKTGKPRLVPIPARVREELGELLALNPWPPGPERFVFYSTDPLKPMDQTTATLALYDRLKAIGVNAEKRRERGLCYHSWRHTFNSLLINRRVPLQMVQGITGHLTDAMSAHYYHAAPEDFGEVRQIQAGLLGIEKKV